MSDMIGEPVLASRRPAVTPAAPGLAARTVAGLRRNAKALAFYAIVLVIWEAASRAGVIKEYLLPGPSLILAAMIDSWPDLVANSLTTLQEIILGFAIGSIIGFLLGIGIVYSRFLEQVIYPLVLMTQAVPKLAIAPLFIVWFGVGLMPTIAITALICLFPVLVNTVVGLRSVDPRLLQLMHSVSASGWQIFWMVRLPTAMPSIFAGLEIGVTLAVVGAIVGEWVGADAGLGYQILIANSQLQTANMFGALVAITAISAGLFIALKVIERIVLPRRAHGQKPT
jgi:NitT/TauT family transport system permease protein